jgi:hypothetical protein
MFKEMLTQEQIQEQIQELTQHLMGEQDARHPADMVTTMEFSSLETWVLTWFQHETIDVGQTDAEVLQSFQDFVNDKIELNRQLRMETGEHIDKHCLMGAEDRWRWHGSNEDGSPNDHAPAPCRCKHCKAQGKIRIGH